VKKALRKIPNKVKRLFCRHELGIMLKWMMILNFMYNSYINIM